LVDAGLEGGDAAGEIVPARVVVIVDHILAQPTSQRLEGHQIGAVARQRHQHDAQRRGHFPYRPGLEGAIPQHGSRAVGMLGTQPASTPMVCSPLAHG
jgi:hypothetical protein